MAIYVTSDLHGFPLEKFLGLLSQASFSDADWLYILGDVIDRHGDGGVELLTWLLAQPNAQLILGNHEAMLLSCSWLFDAVTQEAADSLTVEQMELFYQWLSNGADSTLKALRALFRDEPEVAADLLDYLREAPLYETVSAGGQDFLLTHAGLGDFRPDKRLSAYQPEDLLWNRPSPDDRYFRNIHTVFGHTPTECFGREYCGRAFHTSTWTDIDTGAAGDGSPMLLRLDDMKEFYC